MKIIDILKAIKHSIHLYYVLYADSAEMLEKAQEQLRPLPEGCKIVRLTYENKNLYKCTFDDVDKMLQAGRDVWAVINNDNEIIAFHFGTYRGEKSIFFNVKNCDFEHISIVVDKKYRRKGIALHLLYHTVKNLNYEDVKNKRLGTCIKPSNTKSIKLHELIGFKKSHILLFIHIRRKKDGRYKFINIPRYNI